MNKEIGLFSLSFPGAINYPTNVLYELRYLGSILYLDNIKDKNIEDVYLKDIKTKINLVWHKRCINLFPSLLHDEDAFKIKEPEILEENL